VNVCWNQKPAEIDNFPTKPFQQVEPRPTGDDGNNPPAGAASRREGAPFSS
jgi:hypothetical protein